jgi:hypothetical protein
VVSHLEQVHPRQAARQEQRIHVVLDVAGEQEAAVGELAQEDDRAVVDLAVLGRSSKAWRDVGVGPQDAERGRVEADAVPGGEAPGLQAMSVEGVLPGLVGGAVERKARLEDTAHAVAVERLHQAGDVIVMGVGQDDSVQAPIPGRNVAVQGGREHRPVRPAVHKDAAPTIALDEDRVALPHVEDDDVDTAVGPGGDDATGEDDG